MKIKKEEINKMNHLHGNTTHKILYMQQHIILEWLTQTCPATLNFRETLQLSQNNIILILQNLNIIIYAKNLSVKKVSPAYELKKLSASYSCYIYLNGHLKKNNYKIYF